MSHILKKIILFVSLVVAVAAMAAFARAEEPGYVFKMKEDRPLLMMGLEEDGIEEIPYADGYYTADTMEDLQSYIDAGLVECWDENAELRLFENVETPNDPYYSKQWYLDFIGAGTARKLGIDGTGVKVAVIDSGLCIDHEDLVGGDVTARNILGSDSYVNYTQDDLGHGSMTAGIMAAQTNNGIGVVGLTPNVSMLGLRIFSAKASTNAADTGSGTIAKAISALSYAMDQETDVINMSFGMTSYYSFTTFNTYLKEAENKGVLIFASAGNDGNTAYNYPASLDSSISVASCNSNGSHSYFSNRNNKVWVTAPGASIYNISNKSTEYKSLSGTSFSSPIAAALGVMAKQIKPSITQSEMKELLKISAVDAGTEGYDTSFGWGIVNIPNMLDCLGVTEIASVSVETMPTKLSYKEGLEGLTLSGGSLMLTYSDGSTRTIGLTHPMVSGFDNTKVGQQTLTVNYAGKSTSFEVSVIPKAVESISVSTKPAKLSYLEGKETLDITGGEITVAYDNETTEVIAMTEDMVSGFSNAQAGQKKVVVSYEGKTTYFYVVIRAKSVTEITLENSPEVLEYLEAKDALNVSGGTIRVSYDNDTEESVAITESMITGFDNTQVGEQTLTVTYGGKSCSYKIQVIAKTLTGIGVFQMPDKVYYLQNGDAFSAEGIIVKAYYNNDTSCEIPADRLSITGFNTTVVGKQTLTVQWNEQQTEMEVEVLSPDFLSISIAMYPEQNEINLVSDSVDTTGGKLVLDYGTSTKQIDMADYMVSGLKTDRVGTQTLTVTFGDKTTSYTVMTYLPGEIPIEFTDVAEADTYYAAIYDIYGKLLMLRSLTIENGSGAISVSQAQYLNMVTAKLFMLDSAQKPKASVIIKNK